MQIIIKTKNIELTPSFENIIKKRMSRIGKMVSQFQESATLLVEVVRETKHHRKGDIFLTEAIIHLPRKKLVATAHGENLSKSVTAVKNEILREIRKYKTKVIEVPRRRYRRSVM